MDNTKYYIAYGSNLNVQQMASRCPNAIKVGISMLKNYQLVFCGCATLIPIDGAETPVAIWEIDEASEIALDRYEGFPLFYNKEYLDIEINGKNLHAMIYLMNQVDICIPPSSYFQIILDGYHDFGLDSKYLNDAYAYSAQQMHSDDNYFNDTESSFA